MRPSNWIVGLLTASFVLTGLFIFVGSLNDEYTLDGFTEEQYTSLDQTQNFTSTANELQTSVNSIEQSENWLDIVGGFLGSTFGSIKIVFQSGASFNELAESGSQNLHGMGQGIKLLKDYAITVVSILLALMLLAALIKWRL